MIKSILIAALSLFSIVGHGYCRDLMKINPTTGHFDIYATSPTVIYGNAITTGTTVGGGSVDSGLFLNSSGIISTDTDFLFNGSTATFSGLVASTASITVLKTAGITSGGILMSGGSGPVTGSGVLSNGVIPIGDGGGTPTFTTISAGDTDRVTVTNGAGSITLSGPQDINTTSLVRFGNIGVGAAAQAAIGVYASMSGTTIEGLDFSAAASGASTAISGIVGLAYAATGATHASIAGADIMADVEVAGSTATVVYGAKIRTGSGVAGGVATKDYGFYSYMTRVGDVGKHYGFYASTVTGAGKTTEHYNFYSASAPAMADTNNGYAFVSEQGNSVFNRYYATGSSVTVNAADNGVALVVGLPVAGGSLTTADTFINFMSTSGVTGSVAGSAVAGTIAYNVTSDRRLKKNILDSVSGGDIIDSIQIRQFDWRGSGARQRYGVIAQELVPVFPEAVNVGGADVRLKPWQVDYSKLVPLLIKEIQDLRSRVSVLEKKE